MSGRSKRVLVYTASLLLAPLPVMPYAKGTPQFALAVIAWGVMLSAASLYVVRGEMRLKARGQLGNKLLASATLTLLLGAYLIVGSILYLSRT